MSGSRPTPSSISRRRQAPQGKFEDGVWYCGCEPPQEAAFLQVKKDNKNKGRFFLTCPKPRESQCGFYLWQDDAKAREETLQQKSVFSTKPGVDNNKGMSSGPVMSNNNSPATSSVVRGAETSRGETPQSEVASNIFYSPRSSVFPTPAPNRGMFRGIPRVPNADWSSGDDSDVSKDDRYPATPAPKRKRSEAEAGTEAGAGGADLSDIDSDEARMLVEAADRSERQHQSSGQKSRTSSQTLSQLSDAPPVSTPSAGRGNTRAVSGFGFGGLPTPQSGNSFTSGASFSSEPGVKRLRTADGTAAAAAAVFSTPTPARSRNALALGGGRGGQPSRDGNDYFEDDAEITTKVLCLLKPEPVSPAVWRAVRDTLNLHALRARGVERARDMVREALKKRDAQMAELQARVVKLENERAMRRQVLRKAASELDALCGDEREDCE